MRLVTWRGGRYWPLEGGGGVTAYEHVNSVPRAQTAHLTWVQAMMSCACARDLRQEPSLMQLWKRGCCGQTWQGIRVPHDASRLLILPQVPGPSHHLRLDNTPAASPVHWPLTHRTLTLPQLTPVKLRKDDKLACCWLILDERERPNQDTNNQEDGCFSCCTISMS